MPLLSSFAPIPRRPRPRPLTARLALVFCLLLAGPAAGLAGPPRYAVAGHERPVALLAAGRATYLVTEHGVWRREGRQFVRRYQSAAPLRCALAADSGGLWLGTQQGLLRLSGRTWQARPLALPAPAGPAPITALLQDAAGTVWVGVGGYGLYQLVGGEWQSQLRIPTVNAGVATADSAVWVATNIGLYRWQRGEWTRYNEEGVANHEIPDNLVENLLPDNGGRLWVLMSEGISVFEPAARPGAGGEAHLPTVRFLGRPGNEVYSVADVPGQGHLFATAMGLLLLPAPAGGELPHFEPDPATDKVETPRVLVPLTLPGTPAAGPRLLHVDARQRVWVVSPGEVQVWRARAFRRATQPASVSTAKVVAKG